MTKNIKVTLMKYMRERILLSLAFLWQTNSPYVSKATFCTCWVCSFCFQQEMQPAWLSFSTVVGLIAGIVGVLVYTDDWFYCSWRHTSFLMPCLVFPVAPPCVKWIKLSWYCLIKYTTVDLTCNCFVLQSKRKGSQMSLSTDLYILSMFESAYLLFYFENTKSAPL